MIHRGKIAADGPVGVLVRQATGGAVATFEAAGTCIESAAAALAGVRVISPADSALRRKD